MKVQNVDRKAVNGLPKISIDNKNDKIIGQVDPALNIIMYQNLLDKMNENIFLYPTKKNA